MRASETLLQKELGQTVYERAMWAVAERKRIFIRHDGKQWREFHYQGDANFEVTTSGLLDSLAGYSETGNTPLTYVPQTDFHATHMMAVGSYSTVNKHRDLKYPYVDGQNPFAGANALYYGPYAYIKFHPPGWSMLLVEIPREMFPDALVQVIYSPDLYIAQSKRLKKTCLRLQCEAHHKKHPQGGLPSYYNST